MKKFFLFILCMATVLTGLLTACGDKSDGTYYPNIKEMQANLNQKGYRVQYAVGERNAEGQGYVVDSLVAEQGDDYLYFYWVEEAAHCTVYYERLQELHPDCPQLVRIEKDEKFGNIVYGGTENAIRDAGIKTVNVKADVNVKI